jgi:hypothetical protein
VRETQGAPGVWSKVSVAQSVSLTHQCNI